MRQRLVPANLPRPADPAAAEMLIERFAEQGMPEARFAATPGGRALLRTLGGNSPYLGDLAVREAPTLRRVIRLGPSAVVDAAVDAIAALPPTLRQAETMAALRAAKRRASLAIAVADIAGWWDVAQVTQALSELAEAALRAAARHVLRAAHDAGELRLRRPEEPDRGSGLIVLGMGKLGARELNYSSDVDLIVLYDPAVRVYHGEDIGAAYVRLARGIVRLMEERTEGGYVFRTDLRLRPDPAATPMAVSLPAALAYYESLGQTWERAAMIKARAVAGDVAAGQSFLREIRPFVWRRNLDFAALADIQNMKARIHAHKGFGGIGVIGHDVKLGRGGIREVEFTAQALQLIWGGRDPELRIPATIGALEMLAARAHLDPRGAATLAAGYRYLRRVEHRIQMVADRQTHILPDTEEGLAQFATFMGAPTREKFAEDLVSHLAGIEQVYSGLFEAPAEAGAQTGATLQFDGPDDDPATLDALSAMGFANPVAVTAGVRGWLAGRTRATRSARARELIRELAPMLLAAIARQPRADAAFARLDAFMSQLPAGVQLLSLFHRNPALLDRIALVLGASATQADYLAQNPAAVEGLIAAELPDPKPAASLKPRLADADHLEAAIEDTRRFVHENSFRISVATLEARIDANEAGIARARLADAALGALLPRVMRDFTGRWGRMRGGAVAVIGMGKLGGREMMAQSDLDLILVYDHDPAVEASEGRRPMAPQVWFGRLTTAFVSAITAPGLEGALYAVDMRLRPSGNKGPVAVRLSSFERYQAEDAWTWERMALTRGRVLAGAPALRRRIDAAIAHALTRPCDADKVRADATAMRARMLRELPAQGPWDMKLRPGGQIEVEFIAQVLQLLHAPRDPSVLHPTTRIALARLAKAGALPADEARTLIAADHLWRTIQGMLRLTVVMPREPELPAAAAQALLRAAGIADMATLRDLSARTADAVRALFIKHIGAPA